jgi:hypothetical protein
MNLKADLSRGCNFCALNLPEAVRHNQSALSAKEAMKNVIGKDESIWKLGKA